MSWPFTKELSVPCAQNIQLSVYCSVLNEAVLVVASCSVTVVPVLYLQHAEPRSGAIHRKEEEAAALGAQCSQSTSCYYSVFSNSRRLHMKRKVQRGGIILIQDALVHIGLSCMLSGLVRLRAHV